MLGISSKPSGIRAGKQPSNLHFRYGAALLAECAVLRAAKKEVGSVCFKGKEET